MPSVIALIFDFDDTLAPDSTTGLLRDMGVDAPRFWKETVDPLLAADWDPVPAYLHCLIELSQAGTHGPITRDRLADWGRRLPLHEGVTTLFDRLRAEVQAVDAGVQLEFYLITSGIGDVVRNTPIASAFTDIWASEFSYDETVAIRFPRRIVSFTDKTRYLFHIQKGIVGPRFRGRPFEVNRKVPDERLRVPFDRMVFVGDGYTDIPCFSLVRKSRGIAFGVWDPLHRDRRERAWGFIEDGRVSNLNHARYEPTAELYQMLEMAVTSLARRIALAGHSYGG